MLSLRPHLFASLFLLIVTSGKADETADLSFTPPAPLSKSAYAFNSNLLMVTALQGFSYGTPEFKAMITPLQPGGLRFPGGTTANNYLWRQDSYSLQKDNKTKWAAQQLELFRKIGRKYDLPGYARLCRETGMEPIWVLNVYEETPESVIDLFKHLDKLGLKLKAIELGNEPYWDPRSLMNVHKYMSFCRPLATAIREHRPEVKIGACFGPARGRYQTQWNAPLAKEDWYDAVVYHEYYGGQGFALEKGEKLPQKAMLHPEELFDEAITHLKDQIGEKPIWFTEWNIGQKGLDQWKNKGAELLFLAASCTRLLEHREVIEWSCFHQIYESKFGTFTFKKGSGPTTQPSYEFFRLFGAALSECPSVAMADTPKDAPIRGFRAEGKNGPRYFLFNRSEHAATIKLNLPGASGAVMIKATPDELLPSSSGLTKKLSIKESSITIPPFSIVLAGSPEIVKQAVRVERNLSANLLPARPHLTLWYPPYARAQPRVSPEGIYEVDFSKFADKETAVIKMNLQGIAPKEGKRYLVSFQAKAAKSIGFVHQLPKIEKDPESWIQLTPKFEPMKFEFIYTSEVNKGELSFIKGKNALSSGTTMTFQDFSIVEIK